MLQPKRVRYRRPQDGRGNKGNASRGTQLAFGSFGIKTLEAKWIDSRQIEAASPPTCVWVRVREIPQDGWHPSLPAASSSKWKA